MEHDLRNLRKLSENKVHFMDYPESDLKDWKTRKTNFLESSEAPKFIKEILIHKNKKRPHLFFGEAYVSFKLGNTTKEGWFNSWDWISSKGWMTGQYSKSNDPKINDLKNRFYEGALVNYIGKEKLSDLLEVQKDFSLKPEPPDLWLVDKNNKHYFIEVKRNGDTFSDAQILGLALIYVCLKYQVHLLWLYEERKRPPNKIKLDRYIKKFNKFRENIKSIKG